MLAPNDFAQRESRVPFLLSAQRLLAVVVIALLAATALSQTSQPVNPRQQPPSPEPVPAQQRPGKSVIRTSSDLVLIDVRVTARSGNPVRGLKPLQFTLLEVDKLQRISSFDYHDIEAIKTAAAEDAKPVVVTLGSVSAPEKVREAVHDRRMLVLFFDMASLDPDQLLRSTAAAQRFLREQMTPADLVAVVAFSNQLRVVSNFTNNRGLLQRAVARLVPGTESQLAGMADAAPAPGEEAVNEDTGATFTTDETEFNIFNTDRKLAAVEALADLLRDIPGKKRSEEHTSELQSLAYLVCRLLLEKK